MQKRKIGSFNEFWEKYAPNKPKPNLGELSYEQLSAVHSLMSEYDSCRDVIDCRECPDIFLILRISADYYMYLTSSFKICEYKTGKWGNPEVPEEKTFQGKIAVYLQQTDLTCCVCLDNSSTSECHRCVAKYCQTCKDEITFCSMCNSHLWK